MPTDMPDEFGFQIIWCNAAPPIDKDSYRLAMGGMVERPEHCTLERMRAQPKVEQSSRLKRV